jgi:DNA-binding NarL/FixJ family response regulator
VVGGGILSELMRVLLADDHEGFRRSVRQLLATTEDLRVVEECADGETALELLRSERLDVAVLDIAMPGMDGLSVARAAQQEELGCRVVILTMHDDPELERHAWLAGVRGYIRKEHAVTQLIPSLRSIQS